VPKSIIKCQTFFTNLLKEKFAKHRSNRWLPWYCFPCVCFASIYTSTAAKSYILNYMWTAANFVIEGRMRPYGRTLFTVDITEFFQHFAVHFSQLVIYRWPGQTKNLRQALRVLQSWRLMLPDHSFLNLHIYAPSHFIIKSARCIKFLSFFNSIFMYSKTNRMSFCNTNVVGKSRNSSGSCFLALTLQIEKNIFLSCESD